MTDDLVVVLPGIMGSTLVRNGTEVWGPSRRTVLRAIRTLGASVRELRLPPDLGDEDPCDGVIAQAVMPDLHLVPGLWSADLGYETLFARLRDVLRTSAPAAERGAEPPNLLPFPYDWRLSNRRNGRQLKQTVETSLAALRARGGRFADARVTFVCHSMGGLVARWYVEREGGREITRRLITIGTPHRGALEALANLVNGTRRELGPFAIDVTDFARSLPSAYQLLPQYACIAVGGRLSKPTETAIPGLDAQLVADGARFHAALGATADDPVELLPIVGTKQATVTTAVVVGERIELDERIEGEDEGGDATVPRLAATPAGIPQDRAGAMWVAARHGAMHSSDAVLDQLEGILTARSVVRRGAGRGELGMRMPDLVLAGEDVQIDATLHGTSSGALQAVARNERGEVAARVRLTPGDGGLHARLRLPAGGYVVTVAGIGAAAAHVTPIAGPLVAWEAP